MRVGSFYQISLFIAPLKPWQGGDEQEAAREVLEKLRDPLWAAARVHPPMTVSAERATRLMRSEGGDFKPRAGLKIEFVCGAECRLNASTVGGLMKTILSSLTNGIPWEEIGIADHFRTVLGLCELLVRGPGEQSAVYLVAGLQM